MRRIRNHLNLISVLILTAALTISGAISYFHTQQRLETELLDYQNRMKLRMETVVPGVYGILTTSSWLEFWIQK